MSGISFSGMTSGLDTKSLINQLVQVERQPIYLLQKKQTSIQSKIDEWQSVNTKLLSLKGKMATLKNPDTFRSFQASIDNTDNLTVNVDSNASVGSYTVEVLGLAKAEQLSSNIYSDTDTELGYSGDILINGTSINITVEDTLAEIRDSINDAEAGVTASILNISDTDHRLILSADDTGSTGFDIAEGSANNVLQQLGFLDGATSIKNSIDNGAEAELFASRTTSIGTLLELTSSLSGTVTIGDKSVAIDLANDSLEDIKSVIDSAAPTGVTTSIEEVTEDGTTNYKLRISGTTTFADDNNVLQALGVLQGGLAAVAEVQTASAGNTTNGVTAITASNTFADIYGANVVANDTISINGTDHDGASVSNTFTITDVNNTVQSFLDAIETDFGDVTASIDGSGGLVITDNQAGASSLTVNLQENNEGGGALNFGTISVTTEGRERQLQAGQDADLRINNLNIASSTNTITDVIDGVTLNLKKAEEGVFTNIQVEDAPSITKGHIQGFIEDYNSIVTYINEQFSYDAEEKEGGLLMGDTTLSSIHRRIRSIISSSVTGLTGDIDTLIQIGIKSDTKGLLSIDESVLDAALNEDASQVADLFIAKGTASDDDITFISHTDGTKAGTYNVNITAAAEQANISSSTAISLSGITANETLTINDLVANATADIELTAGDTIATIVSKINSTLSSQVNEVHTSDTANTTNGTTPITAGTTFANIFGANVQANDTIAISGVDHDGNQVSDTYTISDTNNTIQNFLTAIEDAFDNSIAASVDANGRLTFTDNTAGESELSITITANNEGGGSLDFGTITASMEGRHEIFVTAENDGGKLKLTHSDYGDSNGFSVLSTVADNADGNSSGIGNVLQEDYGVDIAGTINGESATGAGKVLTGADGNDNTAGMIIRVDLTPGELQSQGEMQGTVKLTMGAAEQMDNLLSSLTDSYEGTVTNRQDALQSQHDGLQSRMDRMEKRLTRYQERVERQFMELERAMNEITSQGNFLFSQLGGLS